MEYSACLTNCHQLYFFKKNFISTVNYMRPRRITVYQVARGENGPGEIVEQWIVRPTVGDYKAVKDAVVEVVKKTLGVNNCVKIVFRDF